ncbi:kinase-like domain-containing protein [Suillus paluster]|uniref:kinase-like domain-containing protein n=1 Tax=Suillus paluster TaxID=48578 RepID=UPI001B8870B3|nr:kinase-like domain-containing protein [Suillus paluster]KAG1741464.1 kinase-like domain-containing protein [Suillus paluster]
MNDQSHAMQTHDPQSLTPPSIISIPDLTDVIIRHQSYPTDGGAYGDIYRCTYHTPEGDVEVAVKAIRPLFTNAAELAKISEIFRREFGIWKRLEHPKILNLIGTTQNFGPLVASVAPWMVNGTLTLFLKKKNTLKLRDRLRLLRDIAEGLDYLHNGHPYLSPVVHGDLTGNNVLINNNGSACLTDFGLSGTLSELAGMTYLIKTSCRPGALRWTAPEFFSGDESAAVVTTQSDIYSFGSIMLQVLTGDVPWSYLKNDGAITLHLSQGIIHRRPPSRYVTDRCWDFILRCWSTTPNDRPSAAEALQFVVSEQSLA